MHYVKVFADEDAIRHLGVENAPSDEHEFWKSQGEDYSVHGTRSASVGRR